MSKTKDYGGVPGAMGPQDSPCPQGYREGLWRSHGILIRDPKQEAYWRQSDAARMPPPLPAYQEDESNPPDPLTGLRTGVVVGDMQREYDWDRGWTWKARDPFGGG